jgi:hypothetical protein
MIRAARNLKLARDLVAARRVLESSARLAFATNSREFTSSAACSAAQSKMTVPTDIYLDHNATTPLWPSVMDKITESLQYWGNPSSTYGTGTDHLRGLNKRWLWSIRIICAPWRMNTSNPTNSQ